MPATTLLSLPVAVPETVKNSSRKVSLTGRRTFFHGRRFIACQAWNAFYTVMVNIIPDDAYDWEDAAVAEFLGEDLTSEDYSI